MADQPDLEQAFTGLTRDITSRVHRPSPAGLTRRARQRRSRRMVAATAAAVVTVAVGASLLPTAVLSGDHQPASTGHPAGREGSTPVQQTATPTQTCTSSDTSSEDVIAGVTLTWQSSFRCANAPRTGTYQFTVTATNTATSGEAVTLDSLQLTHTTPRPGGQGPDATGETTQLPLTLEPGMTKRVTVRGTYQLVDTGEGAKAGLHFLARGHGTDSAERLTLGINVHLHAPGTAG